MASNLITNLLHQRGIQNINRIEFIKDRNNLKTGNDNEIAIVKFNNRRQKDLHLFLKICKQGSFSFLLSSELLTFAREKLFYDILLPLLADFQYERTFRGMSNSLAIDYLCFKCIGSGKVNGNDCVIMERFCDRLYYVTRANEFHSSDQVCYTLRAIANFHAVSYCRKMIKKFDFVKEFPLLEEKLFRDSCSKEITSVFHGNFKTNLKILQAILNGMNNDHVTKCIFQVTACKKLSQTHLQRLDLISDRFTEIFNQLIDPKCECAVLCHGDFHMGNIAYNKQDARKVKFFDFQAVRFASPLTDLQQYFSLATSPKSRHENMARFLRSYHKAFKACCDELGLSDDLNVFDLEFITKEYKRTAPISFLFGFIFNMSRLVPRVIYEQLQLASSDYDMVNIVASDDALIEVVELYVDSILEASSSGTLDEMENLLRKP